jgi:hypothetical protein
MTDFTDDELVSAVLDGEATDEEAARVSADAALSARLAELRAARDAIAASVSLPSNEHRDRAVTAAMTSAEPAAALRPAVELHDRRRRRAIRVASIAAALLAIAGLVGAVAALSSRESHKAGSAAAGLAPSSASDAVAAAQAAAPPGPSPAVGTNRSAVGADGLAELGSFQTEQDLVDAVKAHTTSAPQNLQAAPGAPTDTFSPAVACGSRADVTYAARASLSGQPVIVIVSGSAGQQTIEVVDVDCAVVFTRPL